MESESAKTDEKPIETIKIPIESTITFMKRTRSTYQRSCGDCTLCCQGWLSTTPFPGREVFWGKPCHYVSEKGCTVYDERPFYDCEVFKCGWLAEQEVFPEWMKPNLCKTIVVFRDPGFEGITSPHYEVLECGQKIDSSVLNYIIQLSMYNGLNFKVQVAGSYYYYGSAEYLEEVSAINEALHEKINSVGER